MCKVCKTLEKLMPEVVSGVDLKLTSKDSICLDHLAYAHAGLKSFTSLSEARLKGYGYSEDDITILKYINRNGLDAYAELLKTCSQYSASSSVTLKEKVLSAIQQEQKKLDNTIDKDAVLRSPRKIKSYLDGYVIGQDKAKEVLAIAIHDHYIRMNTPNLDKNNKKSNVLLIGPSGTGKTYLIDMTSELLGVPFISTSITGITASGYVGGSIDGILKALIRKAGNVKLAETGIIYLDEIDKIAGYNVSGRDVGGVDVQRELLSILQGCKKTVNVGTEAIPKEVTLDTSNILFICAGAFVEMDERNKLENRRTIGFDKSSVPTKTLKTDIPSTTEFINYGYDIQFIARFPSKTRVEKLTLGELEQIIYKPKNSILAEYMSKFKQDDVDLHLSKSAISAIAKHAQEEGTNARGLRNIFEELLRPYRFNIEDYKGKRVNIGKKEIEACFS